MPKLLLVLLFLCMLSPLAFSAPGAIRCGKLLDVRSGQMLVDQTVVFDASGTITSVGSSSSTKLPDGVTAIDLSSATCLPGLIDVHTHLTVEPTNNGYAGLGISVPRETVTGVKNARLTLRAGFTTVRNVGASGYTDVALRDGIDAGDIDGPRMRVSGPALGITGGHCDNNLLPSEFHHKAEGVADGPWAARAKEPSSTALISSRSAPLAESLAKAISPAHLSTLSKRCRQSRRKPTNLAAKSPPMLMARNPSKTLPAPASIPSSTPA